MKTLPKAKATPKPEQEKPMKSVRMNLRATEEDKEVFEKAASLKKVSLSSFVIQATRAAAEEVLAEQTDFVLSPAQMKALNEALDREPRELPGLADLFSRPDPFKRV